MSKKQTPKAPETSLRRDARTGYFIPVSEARRRPDTTVVERVPLPGKGACRFLLLVGSKIKIS